MIDEVKLQEKPKTAYWIVRLLLQDISRDRDYPRAKNELKLGSQFPPENTSLDINLYEFGKSKNGLAPAELLIFPLQHSFKLCSSPSSSRVFLQDKLVRDANFIHLPDCAKLNIGEIELTVKYCKDLEGEFKLSLQRYGADSQDNLAEQKGNFVELGGVLYPEKLVSQAKELAEKRQRVEGIKCSAEDMIKHVVTVDYAKHHVQQASKDEPVRAVLSIRIGKENLGP